MDVDVDDDDEEEEFEFGGSLSERFKGLSPTFTRNLFSIDKYLSGSPLEATSA